MQAPFLENIACIRHLFQNVLDHLTEEPNLYVADINHSPYIFVFFMKILLVR